MERNNSYASLSSIEFRYFIFAKFLMTFATTSLVVIIGWEVYELTAEKLNLGFLGLVEFIPAMALSLFAGHWVDISEKRSMILRSYGFLILIMMIPLVVNFWYTKGQTADIKIIFLFLTMFLLGVFRSFVSPAAFSLIHQLVERKDLANASTWNSASWQTATVLAPALAGFWYAKFGPFSLYLFNFCLVLIATFFICKIRPKEILYSSSEGIIESLKEGIGFIFSSKPLLWAITLDMLAVFFGGAVALIPVFAKDILHCGPEGFGWLRAATSLGTILVLLSLTYYPINTRPGYKMLIAVFGFGCSMIIFGLSQWFTLSFFALFLSGIFDGISVTVRANILQLLIPNAMKGRVNSVNSVFVSSSNELGAFESGVAAHFMGTERSVIFGGLMTIGISILVYTKVKGLVNFEYYNQNNDHSDS